MEVKQYGFDSLLHQNLDMSKFVDLSVLSGPTLMSWDVTNRCNFSCLHCLNNSAESKIHTFEDELSEEESMRLVDQVIDLKPINICLCGGEPLLRKDLSRIIKRLSDAGIIVSAVSNGFLLDEKRALELKEAGLEFIQISLDGINAETHDTFRNTPGSFDRAFNALEILTKVKIRTAASFAPNRMSINDFPNYVDMMVEAGIPQIRMMPLLPMGRGLNNFDRLEPTKEEYLNFYITIKEKSFQYAGKIDIEWGDPLEHMYIPLTSERKETVMMEVRANGDVGISIYLPLIVGNVRKHTLREYWEGGYDKIWGHPKVIQLASAIRSVHDFKNMQLKTWNDEHIKIDLLDDIR